MVPEAEKQPTKQKTIPPAIKNLPVLLCLGSVWPHVWSLCAGIANARWSSDARENNRENQTCLELTASTRYSIFLEMVL